MTELRKKMSAWLQKILKRPQQDLPLSSPTELVKTGSIKGSDGGVAIGVAQSGASIIVYNLAVPSETIHSLARSTGLTSLSWKQAQDITSQFLNFIEKYYRYLPLKGMGDNSGLRLNFALVELFIPLNARLVLPSADILSDDLRSGGRKLSEEEREQLSGKHGASLPVLNLIAEFPVLMILGDPGSGKSTVLRLLAFLLATGQGDQLGLGGYLPLLLPLAAYSDKLETQPDLNLRQFALDYFQNHVDVAGLKALLDAKLNDGRVLILLDGLDEVKEITQRNTVIDRVQRFLCKQVEQGNRVIMTSRIIGYKEVRPPEMAGLRECTLLDFEDVEIECFISRWTTIIEHKAQNDDGPIARYEAEREADELLKAIKNNPAVRKLAANPLLLTMLVIQKRQGIELPRHRVLLYEQYIVSLLRDWLLARSPNHGPLPDDLALREVLEPLAFWMQTSEPGKGLVNKADLLTWLRNYYSSESNSEKSAQEFVSDVREYSGLLVDAGGERYSFLHLTFMEYLAGVALANRFQKHDGRQQILACVTKHASQAEWRETLLLALGYLGLKQRFKEVVTELLQQLLLEPAKDSGVHHEIVAAALVDMGKDGVTSDGWKKLRDQLVDDGLRNKAIAAVRRVTIGASLAEAGDPRKAVMTVDSMAFCYVPAGSFFLGSMQDDDSAYKDEKEGAGDHQLDKAYWLARYPISVAQFQEFVQETSFVPENADYKSGLTNTPVAYISWEEAMAFCKWLTQRWHENGWLPTGYQVSLPSEPEWEKAAKGGYRIPAAGGRIITPVSEILAQEPSLASASIASITQIEQDNPCPQRAFAWEEKPFLNQDEDQINAYYQEHINFNFNIGTVSTLGAYSGGRSPYGCEDMSGNVWEWTRSLWSDYPYPEALDERKKREGPGSGPRALRGGSFYYDRTYARCAFRLHYNPLVRYSRIGFRVVLSPYL